MTAATSGASSPTAAPLAIHGLDHVRVLARDLEAAKDWFRDALGFALPPRGSNFGHPLGSWQVLARFRDASYLEFLSIKDPVKARSGRPEMMAFLERAEGGHSVVLCVPSAPETSSALRARGLAVTAPVAGSFLPEDEAGPLSQGWWLVNHDAAPFRRETLSFIEYRQPWSVQTAYSTALPVQPNGVTGTRAVWIAVPDARVALAHFSSMGFAPVGTLPLPVVGALAHELVVAPGQSLLVLEATGPGDTAAFLAARGAAGVMGVTLKVAQREAITARSAALGADAAWRAGAFGDSLLLPGRYALGLTLEFVAAP